DAAEPLGPAPVDVEDAGPPGLLAVAADTMSHNARRAARVAWRAAGQALGLVRHPGRLPAAGAAAAELASSAARQVVVTDPARSPLWTQRSLRRRIEVLRAPFDDARAAAKGLGGTLNDLFVAAAA